MYFGCLVDFHGMLLHYLTSVVFMYASWQAFKVFLVWRCVLASFLGFTCFVLANMACDGVPADNLDSTKLKD